MPFVERSFSQPTYSESGLEPKKVVVISCEGRNTEPEYFEAIIQKLSRNLKNLVEVDVINEDVNASSPQQVLSKLERHIENKYDFQNQVDILWLVIDRESVECRKKKILQIIPECESKGYSLAVANPLFEFWLLLHVADISKYNNTQLLTNDWVSPAKNRRFIDKELSNILDGGFNKRKGNFNCEIVSIENIQRALEQEKNFTNTLPDILDNLGSNVGSLIRDILDVH